MPDTSRVEKWKNCRVNIIYNVWPSKYFSSNDKGKSSPAFAANHAVDCNQHYIVNQGVATNSGLTEVGTGSNWDLFCIVRRKVAWKNLFLHRVNNIERNIKQNIYTGMEVISHIPPWYCCKNRKNDNVLINNINNLYII